MNIYTNIFIYLVIYLVEARLRYVRAGQTIGDQRVRQHPFHSRHQVRDALRLLAENRTAGKPLRLIETLKQPIYIRKEYIYIYI